MFARRSPVRCVEYRTAVIPGTVDRRACGKARVGGIVSRDRAGCMYGVPSVWERAHNVQLRARRLWRGGRGNNGEPGRGAEPRARARAGQEHALAGGNGKSHCHRRKEERGAIDALRAREGDDARRVQVRHQLRTFLWSSRGRRSSRIAVRSRATARRRIKPASADFPLG